MARALIIIAVVAASAPAWAQQGVWTGYVGGWQYTPQQPQFRGPLAPNVSRRTAVVPQYVPAYSYFPQQQVVVQKESSRREVDELNARRVAIEEQERALAELRTQQALYVAEEQRRIAEEERKIAQARTQEADAARRELEVTKAQLEQKKLEEALAAREKEIAAREAERLKEPQTPGPKVYKWVDEDGVTHFSTRPRG